ncbi:thiolase family protein [Spongiibacter marinus]|uniref:thiolase family protein n=1 Tax=Spongiibacter marinus TaxID=354246 RepID=UPI0035BE16B8
MTRKVGVIGVGNTPYTSAKRETRERSEIGRACIKDAIDFVGNGLTLADIDAVYYTTVDGFEGTQRPDRTMDCLVRGSNAPVYFVNTGGTSGGSTIKDAYRAVASGLYDIVVVYGAGSLIATKEAQQILNSASPPMIESESGIGAMHIGGFYLNKYRMDYGITDEDFAAVSAKSHKHAKNNPNAHIRKGYTVEEILASPVIVSPIRLLETCPVSSGACSMILCSEEKARELSETPVWIKAASSISNSFTTAYRDFSGFGQLEVLAQRVYEKAGIKNPLEEIDYAELFNPFGGFELLEYEALGLCGKGEAPRLVHEGVTDLGGKLPVNLSGSTLCTNSGVAASLTRQAETCLQLMGRVEGGRQVENARLGLAHSWGGNMGQFDTLTIYERD